MNIASSLPILTLILCTGMALRGEAAWAASATTVHPARSTAPLTSGVTGRTGAQSGMPGHRRGADRLPATRGADQRAQRSYLVESNLRDISADLEKNHSQQMAVQPGECPRCGDPAKLPPATSAEQSNATLRGNLHRLHREARVRAEPQDLRKQRVEDTLERARQAGEPGIEPEHRAQ